MMQTVSMSWAIAVMSLMLLDLVGKHHAHVIWMVPNSRYTKVWNEWRNPNCLSGSVWRPMLDKIDPGNGKLYEPVLLGDVFMPGTGPPNFPSTMLVLDEDIDSCASGTEEVFYPCMEVNEHTGGGTPVPPLFAMTEWPTNSTLWTAQLAQCTCGNEIVTEDGFKCTANAMGSQQPRLDLDEDGYSRGQAQMQLKAPLCPDNYYVMGHVGTMAGVPVPDNYKCIHKRLLRRAGDANGDFLYKSATPLAPATEVWSETAAANPTIIPEYLQGISVYAPNCGHIACPETITSRMCDNDTFSLGLFYADQYPPMRITASRNPDDVENLAPWVGPRCLVHYRGCDDDCDYELGLSLTEEDLNEETGDMEPAQRRGLIYTKPWGVPLARPDNPGGEASLGSTLELFLHQRVCNLLRYDAGDLNSYPWVFLNYYPKQGQKKLIGAIKVQQVTFADPYNGIPWCLLDLRVTFEHLRNYPTRVGPVVVRIVMGSVNPEVSGAGVMYADPRNDAFEVSRSIGKLYFYDNPGLQADLLPSVVYNGPTCESSIFIAIPQSVLLMHYWNIDCLWRDSPDKDWSPPRRTQLELHGVPNRGILCVLPPKTGENVQFQVSLNDQHYHTVTKKLRRITPSYDDDAAPGSGAARVYSIVPRSGDAKGGTQITITGTHFTSYNANDLKCRFRFISGAGDIDVLVQAIFLDDTRLQCTTPPAANFATETIVTITLDGSSFCVEGAKANADDIMIEYNKHTFYYTEMSPTPVPNVAWDQPVIEWKKCYHNTSGPLFATHVQSTPSYPPAETPIPQTPIIDCSHLPNSDISVANLGYFGCFSLHNSWAQHNDEDPQWCARALPANGGVSYIFHMYDPFHNMIGYMVKEVPVDFPGTCNRHRSSSSLEVKIKFINILEVVPQPGRTVEEEWATVEQDVVSDLKSREHVTHAAAYLRSTNLGREAKVDWELRLELQHKEAVIASLASMRKNVTIGKPIRGLYSASTLRFGSRGIKVLRMDAPVLSEERSLTPWSMQLDYRVNDIHSPKFDLTQILDLDAPTNFTTKGQQLVDGLFSHQALTYGDGRDISYMRQELHRIGRKYGFLDLTSSFFIEWDATMASEYDEDHYRLQYLCNKAPSDDWKLFSGFEGDFFTYIDWQQQLWDQGRPICNNPACAKPPYAEPAQILKTFYKGDKATGCVRLRVGFKDCTDFDLGKCYKEKADPDYNILVGRQDKHTGTRTKHLNSSGWCDSYYPEEFGPNNYNEDEVKQANYRYRYRLSPCILCRQAKEVCDALKKGENFKDGDAERRDNGDLDYVAEIPLGCFGMGHSGAVLDQCCDRACDGSCESSMEACVRSRVNPVCAHPAHATKNGHASCFPGTPVCTPREYAKIV